MLWAGTNRGWSTAQHICPLENGKKNAYLFHHKQWQKNTSGGNTGEYPHLGNKGPMRWRRERALRSPDFFRMLHVGRGRRLHSYWCFLSSVSAENNNTHNYGSILNRCIKLQYSHSRWVVVTKLPFNGWLITITNPICSKPFLSFYMYSYITRAPRGLKRLQKHC
jgi:hypothetical protein